ncbi:MAG: type II toxin-antitoxin system VapC family toxin [Bifidobacteriaceae bacterium]|nr:type II toxin-antitoxin system VapC family toxin [Bifidobacteriaceae bacterium]
MILLDTNVISEPLRKGGGDPKVRAWLDNQSIETLCLSVFAVAELFYGIAAMSPGRVRNELERRVTQEVLPAFAGRVLVFDQPAARASAKLHAAARAAGKPIPDTASFIAGLAASRKLTVATRNTKHFEAAGVPVINPWG